MKRLVSEKWNKKIDKPFEIGGESFNKYFILVDRAYPNVARFVNSLGDSAAKVGEK